MTTYHCELEVAEGIEDIAQAELMQRINNIAHLKVDKGAIRFDFSGKLSQLLELKTIIAAYLLHTYEVPRPKALLGHQHFHHMLSQIELVTKNAEFKTFYLSAAGSDSSVMQRIKAELEAHTGLSYTDDTGDLFLRIRRVKQGWDVLTRISPRPNVTREWRVCNMEGALNASIAHAMVMLSQPAPDDVFVNLACGSGTLMIERKAHRPAKQIIGCDIEALMCARENGATGLIQTDVTCLPFQDGFADVICADLPFGQLVGSHQDNLELYPAVLNEAARIAKKDAVFIVITHEVRLMEKLLAQSSDWKTEQVRKVLLRGLHPRIFVLRSIG